MGSPQTELIAICEGREIARYRLEPGVHTIGRAPSSAVLLELEGVSRRHAQITYLDDSSIMIEDLGSTAGTFVDDTPVSGKMPVSLRQAIRVGNVSLFLRQGALTELDGASNTFIPHVSVAPGPREASRYELGEEIAKGGMGAVLAARQTAAGRTVAMKVMIGGLQTSDEHRLRFIEEAQITSQLEHPNIVPVHDVGVDEGGRHFYTMKLVHGVTLKQIFHSLKTEPEKNAQRYSLPVCLTIFQKICDAMAFAHSKSVIHRDLKPANIMVGRFGEVLVMDWGIAKLIRKEGDPSQNSAAAEKHEDETAGVQIARTHQDESRTIDGSVIGTPHYMAPEQAQGDINSLDARTDIFALGVMLYELLVLETPCEGRSTVDILDNVRNGRVVPIQKRAKDSRDRLRLLRRDVPESLAAVATKALSRAPGDRYQTVQALQADITAYQNGFATAAESPNLARQVLLLVRRHREKFAIGAGALLIILVASLVFVFRLNTEKNLAKANERRAVESERDAKQSAEEANVQAEAARIAGRAAEEARLRADEARTKAEVALANELRAEALAKAAQEAQENAKKEAVSAKSGQTAALAKADDASKRAETAAQMAQAAQSESLEVRKASATPILRDGFTAAAAGDFAVALLHFSAVLKAVEADAAASAMERRRIALYQRYSPHLLAEWQVSNGNLAAFSPDSKQLVTAGPGGPVKIPVGDNELINLTQLNQEAATLAEWSPDGRILAVGGWENFGLYTSDSLALKLTPRKQPATCQHLRFLPDGSGILVINSLETNGRPPAWSAILYDLKGRPLVTQMTAPVGNLGSIGFRDAGRIIAVFDSADNIQNAGRGGARKLQLAESVDHARGDRIFNHSTVLSLKGRFVNPGIDASYVPFAVSPDAEYVGGVGVTLPNQAALFAKKDGSIAGIKEKDEVSVATFPSAVRSIIFSSDSRFIALSTMKSLYFWNIDWKFKAAGIDRPPCIANLPDALDRVAFSTDSAWLAGIVPMVDVNEVAQVGYGVDAVGSKGLPGEGVWVWNLGGSKELIDDAEATPAILRHNRYVTGFRFDPKGRLMVTTSKEFARLWRLGSGDLPRVTTDLSAFNLSDDFRQKQAPLDADFASKLRSLGRAEPIEFSTMGQRIAHNKDKSLAVRIRGGSIQVFAGAMPLSPPIACPGVVNAAFVDGDQSILLQINNGTIKFLDLTPDLREPEELTAIAELLSGKTRLADGKTVDLDQSRLLSLQAALTKKYGQEFQLGARKAP